MKIAFSNPYLQSENEVSESQSNYVMPVEPIPRNVGAAIAETVGLNITVWAFGQYVMDQESGAHSYINLDTMRDNLTLWFEWDPNHFSTNFFAHPYHGGLYFNAGRTNGLDFWASSFTAFGGSFMWEVFMENHRPSINDLALNLQKYGTLIFRYGHYTIYSREGAAGTDRLNLFQARVRVPIGEGRGEPDEVIRGQAFEVVEDLVGALVSLLRFFFDRALYDLAESSREELGGDLDGVGGGLLHEELHERLFADRGLSGEALEKNKPPGVEVILRARGGLKELLRGHVCGRAWDVSGAGQGAIILVSGARHQRRDAEVEDHGVAPRARVGDHDVVRLEVAVNHPLFVRIREGLEALFHEPEGPRGGDGSLKNFARQGLPVNKLEDEEGRAIVEHPGVDQADDVRMLELRDQLHLALEARDHKVVARLTRGLVEDLDRDDLSGGLLPRSVDGAEAALTKGREELVLIAQTITGLEAIGGLGHKREWS